MDASMEPKTSLEPKSLSSGDYAFFALIALVLVAVTILGSMAYREAMKTEGSKRNGEQWVHWLSSASEARFAPDYAIAACAGGAKAAAAPGNPEGSTDAAVPAAPAAAGPVPGTWGACLAHLSGAEFKNMRNPFTGKAPHFIAACDPFDRSVAGSIVIEKTLPNPPGSAVATVTSQLVEADSIAEKMQLKISVCDKGSYAVKVAELEF